jgi:HD-GYP domain-containing protein (c-di-GMP phosphodiesterase class II)
VTDHAAHRIEIKGVTKSTHFESVVAAVSERLTDSVVLKIAEGFIEVERGALRVLVATLEAFRSGTVSARLVESYGALPSRLIVIGDLAMDELPAARALGSIAVLREDVRPVELLTCIEQAFELLLVQRNNESHNRRLSRTEYELDELIDVARALTKERDTSRLLGLILERSRYVTSADAGSLYVVERSSTESSADITGKMLHFRLSQNDSIAFDSAEFKIPVSRSSMAGFVVLEKSPIRIDDVYELPENSPFSFDRSFDKKTGYRTKSMLCAPLISSRGEVIGVLQLINKKRNSNRKLRSETDVNEQVVPFDDHSERLLVTLAAQAGIALENALLYDEIRGLFEGFVRASVDAIEARDPTTSGHSLRVAELTLRLADAVERCDEGTYRDVRFSAEGRREIEYASLLHDFGKIGVRENVLVKEKKLFPHELEAIRLRIELALRDVEVENYRLQLELRKQGASEEEVLGLSESIGRRRSELMCAFETIRVVAEPTVLKSQDRALLDRIESMTLRRADGRIEPLLTGEELLCLNIERGSLTMAEIDEIRSHVTHTFRFLSRIPWGASLRNVPSIAGAHHERLNGTGYPLGLREKEIPLPSKMMSVADIFDALTASDRPYKRAIPVPRALEILDMEVKDQHLDAELVKIFREARVWSAET